MGKRHDRAMRNMTKGAYTQPKVSSEEAKEKRDAIWTILKILFFGLFLGSVGTFVLMFLYAGGGFCS